VFSRCQRSPVPTGVVVKVNSLMRLDPFVFGLRSQEHSGAKQNGYAQVNPFSDFHGFFLLILFPHGELSAQQPTILDTPWVENAYSIVNIGMNFGLVKQNRMWCKKSMQNSISLLTVDYLPSLLATSPVWSVSTILVPLFASLSR
jgi:hypothetical protein